jgi:membrane associated rhomboid family serine protease
MSGPPKRARGSPVPWLSAGIVILCIAATFYAQTSSREAHARADAGLRDAEAYFIAHPYLYPGQVLEDRLTGDFIEGTRADWNRARRRSGSPPTPPRVRRRQQEELKALVDQALVPVEESPARHLTWNVWKREPVSLFTHILPHAGQWHLIGNALLLVLLGAYLETRMGRLLYGVSLLTCAAGSAWVFAFANPALDFALIGLSGTLAGLLALFTLRHWRDRQEGFYALGVLGGALWLVLPVWFGVQWSLEGTVPGMAAVARPGVSFSALAGGAAMGIVLAASIGLLRLDERLRGGTHLHGRDAMHPLYRRALGARSNRRYREARELLTQLLRSDPEAHDATLLLSHVAGDLGRHDEARDALLRAVRIELKRGLTETAMENWLAAVEEGMPRQAEPALCVRMALLLQESGQPGAALAALRGALERAQRESDASLAARIARAARDLDPGTAEEAAWRALGSMELAYEERQALEVMLGQIIFSRSEPGLELATPVEIRSGAGEVEDDEPLPEEAPQGTATPVPIDIDLEERGLAALDAVPLHCDDEGLHVSVVRSGAKKRVPLDSVDAVAVAAVQGLGPKPVIVVDMVLNWMTTAKEKLRVVRLRTDQFDPRSLVPGIDSPAEALRRFLAHVIVRAGATPLPDVASAEGRPFATFPSLVDYQRTVLLVEAADGAEEPQA